MNKHSILLTGATGYVGGRLLKVLEAQGHSLSCLARTPAYLWSRVAPTTDVFAGDVLDKESLRPALTGVDTAYYLIHSLGESKGFEEQEKTGPRNFAEVARECGVKRIIYLGGMGNEREELSPHLRSRHEVGRILRESGVTTLEFRASIVLGSGSLSFEMIRALTEHLPIMVMPRWVSVLAQPIGIRDVIDYLVQALDIPIKGSEVVEIGGADQLSYRELMNEYARLRNLKRVMIPVPVLTPRLSSLWLGLVTPLYARVGRKLIESIKHPTIVTSNRAHELFALRPCGATEAMRAALENEDRKFAETRWSDSLSASGTPGTYGGHQFGNRMVDYREKYIEASPELAFQVIEGIGGNKGWFGYDFLWRLRGIADLLAGGVGMRRGRPLHRSLRPGDALDFWRVEILERPHKLRLLAEMKVPGRAWLEFVVEPDKGRLSNPANRDLRSQRTVRTRVLVLRILAACPGLPKHDRLNCRAGNAARRRTFTPWRLSRNRATLLYRLSVVLRCPACCLLFAVCCLLFVVRSKPKAPGEIIHRRLFGLG